VTDHADAALALSVVALVPALFSAALPPAAELRTRTDTGADSASLSSAIVGAALVVTVVGAVTGSRPALVAGLAAVLGLGALYSHAVMVNP
jgi:fucose permease